MLTQTHLDIYQLLDRFELLFPENTDLTDLRRGYIDQDLNSIFRLCYKYGELSQGFEICDVHSSVVEQNLHAIFRIINSENLRKVLLEDNYWSLWKLLEEIQPTQFVTAFKNFYVNETEFSVDCVSRGQLESKLWLVNTLKKLDVDLGTVFLCAGWYGTLATMIFESGVKVDKIRSFDIDETTVDIAEVFNKTWFVDNWKFKSIVDDINNINFHEHIWQFWSNANNRMSKPIVDRPDTIINTSCEHIENFDEWYAKIPEGKLVILQSNNYFEVEEHTNCSETIGGFALQSPMKEELFSGELTLPKYKRFMRVGYK